MDTPDEANDHAEIIAQLRAEVEELRKRLKDSEESLRAVQNGNTLPLASSSFTGQVSAYESPVSIRDKEAVLESKSLTNWTSASPVELQMQNEQLRAAQVDLESSRTKYAELFESRLSVILPSISRADTWVMLPEPICWLSRY
jgi:DNA repair exonuclease SbcCD ATPase subunit